MAEEALLYDSDFREYFKISSLLFREVKGCSIPKTASDIWLTLYDLAKFDNNRMVKISVDKLCEMVHRGRSTIESHLKTLEKLNFIKRFPNFSKIGGQLINTYQILIPSHILEKAKNSNKKVSIIPDHPIITSSEAFNIEKNTIFNDEGNRIQSPSKSINTLISSPPPPENRGPFKEFNIELNINNNTEFVGNLISKRSNVVFEKESENEKKLNKWQSSYVSGMLKNNQRFGVRLTNELFDQVTFSLTSEFQFKGCDFKKKVNSISKLLRGGNWRTPIGFYNHATTGPDYRARYREFEKPKTYNLESVKILNDHNAQQCPIEPISKDYATREREDRVQGVHSQISGLDERMRSATNETKALLSKLREVLSDKAQSAMYA